jgi:hypothetical protein
MTLGDQFYLKAYCTANRPGVYRKQTERVKDRANLVTGAIRSGVRGVGHVPRRPAHTAGQLALGECRPPDECEAVEAEAAWDGEIGRRLNEIDSEAVKLIPLEDVLARMDARILPRQRG